MSYLVLARKYRPKDLGELIGQSHVTQTLLNAFQQNKVGQAYIFTGTRGVGKTSIGRILAKALRCETPGHRAGETDYGKPCNQCSACSDVDAGNSLDVLEIDGASNNGVDSVRELRDNIKFMPASGSKKVIIIDEVHMLTTAAFNALLKTLEEPPPHAVLIFATTDIHKVPATILSRCQRFDLKRLPQSAIYEFLLTILEREKITCETAAVQLIARKADGSVRDSLSLTDQVIALSGDKISFESTSEALGLVDRSLLMRILQSVLEQNALAAIHAIHEAYDSGFEMKSLMQELAELYRDALLLKLGEKEQAFTFANEDFAKLRELLPQMSYEAIQVSFQILVQAVQEVSKSPLPLASAELTIARICQAGNLRPINDLFSILQNGTNSQNGVSQPVQSRALPQPRAQLQSTGNGTQALSSPAALTSVSANSVAESKQTNPTSVPVFGAKSTIHPGPSDWKSFVSFAIQTKPSIGSLLEHAIPLDPVSEWKSGKLPAIRLGFRENHLFYLEQAKSSSANAAIHEIIGAFVGKQIKVDIQRIHETKAKTDNLISLSEKKQEKVKNNTEKMKKDFLSEKIVQDTKEIFGAKLTSFKVIEPTE